MKSLLGNFSRYLAIFFWAHCLFLGFHTGCSKFSTNQKHMQGRDPWSSGYGRRLMFQRLWIRIPAPYTGRTFFHKPICCKICNVCLKKTKINEKEAGVGTFLRISLCNGVGFLNMIWPWFWPAPKTMHAVVYRPSREVSRGVYLTWTLSECISYLRAQTQSGNFKR